MTLNMDFLLSLSLFSQRFRFSTFTFFNISWWWFCQLFSRSRGIGFDEIGKERYMPTDLVMVTILVMVMMVVMQVMVPIMVNLMLIFGFIFMGAILFASWEGWSGSSSSSSSSKRARNSPISAPPRRVRWLKNLSVPRIIERANKGGALGLTIDQGSGWSTDSQDLGQYLSQWKQSTGQIM